MFLAAAGLAALIVLSRRIGRLEQEVSRLRRLLGEGPAPHAPVAAAPLRAPARIVARDAPAPDTPAPDTADRPDVADPPAPLPSPSPVRPERASMESLIGGRLPIWVGGAALVLAGFFLVRYAIASALIGPAMRTLFAGLFAAALVAAGEAARRLPATRDDPRVAQALVGAGIASAYGTLYVGAALYALIGVAAAFVLMICITAVALVLALRHGAPTAIMALVGGFAAPLVAGVDVAGVGPLLVYLALLIAALFGLAARRGWSWLAFAAIVAGFGWVNLLLVLLDAQRMAGVAGFVVALAIGAALVLPRTGEVHPRWRVVPLVAGFAQLLVLAPVLDFGAIAWGLYLALAVAALILAWRDAAMLPGAVAAAMLVVLLVAAGLSQPQAGATLSAAVAATLLFAAAGAPGSRRDPRWAFVALLGLAGPVLAAHGVAGRLATAGGWAAIELLLAAAAAAIAWRHRDRTATRDTGLVGGTVTAALLATVGLVGAVGLSSAPLVLAPVAVALGWWAERLSDRDLRILPPVALAAALALAGAPLGGFAEASAASLGGSPLPYPLLPQVGVALRQLAPTLAAAVLLLWRYPHAFARARPVVSAGALTLAILLGYLLAKQVLAIGDPARFRVFGFVERAMLTLCLFGIGWLLVRQGRLAGVGRIIGALALARFAWLDLLLFPPVSVPQQVGAIPLLNTAVLLPATLAAGCATIAATRRWRFAALALSAIAVAAAVRQLAHGTILTGPVGNGETWGYSAAFLLLSVLWLWRGILRQGHDLRVAGLALMTLVTFKVFLVDVATLGGALRILSLVGLGVALIALGWAYQRFVAPRGGAVPSR